MSDLPEDGSKKADFRDLSEHVDTLSIEELQFKLNKETAKIDWQSIERFYAKGMIISVSSDLDLIEVATAFSCDDKSKVEPWLNKGLVARATDQQAILWHEKQASMWAVLVLPWLLVQDIVEK